MENKIDIGTLQTSGVKDIGTLQTSGVKDIGTLVTGKKFISNIVLKTYHIPGLRLLENGGLRLSTFGLRFLR
jgi:hypothetical protein